MPQDNSHKPTNRGKNLTAKKWLKRILITLFVLLLVWTATDLTYSKIIQQNIRRWEATVVRNSEGVREGCEAFTVGNPADKALLFVHGINDTPHVYRKVAPFLADQGAYCRCMRIDGFGESVTRYGQSSTDQWLESVNREVDQLRANGRTVVLVAHSLGGAVALQYVYRFPKKIQSLVLVAPAIKVSSQRSPVFSARFWHAVLRRTLWSTKFIHTPFGVDSLDPTERVNNLRTPYLPIEVIDNLFQLMDRNRELAPQMKLPVMLCLAEQDHVIDNEAARLFFKKLTSPEKKLVMLENSAHAVMVDYQWKQFAETVWEFVGNQKITR